MSRTGKALLATVLPALILSSAAQAGWLHIANSVFQVENEKRQKHPTTLSRLFVMPTEAAEPEICISYRNTMAKRNKGRVVTTVSIMREDGSLETMKFAGGVKDNVYFKCKPTQDLVVGDVLQFDFEFKGMPRLKNDEESPDYFEADRIIAAGGAPEQLDTFFLGPKKKKKGGWLYSANSVFLADSNNQKHPTNLFRTLIVPADTSNPQICPAYSHVSGSTNQGRVVTNVEIIRQDGESESMKFAGGVRGNTYVKCKDTGALAAGDMVEFDFELKGMPKLKNDKTGVDFADVNGIVSTAGEPEFVIPEPPAEDPAPVDDGAPPAAPAPGPTVGGISQADQRAVSSLLMKATKTQLWRPKGNSPGKWVVVGPGTQVISGNQLNYNTAGFGSTIADAWSDYQRKVGGLPAGDLVDSRTISALQWYSSMNSAGGPTSVRRDSGGGYHADYYRPGRGSVITGGFGSVAATIEFLQSQGL